MESETKRIDYFICSNSSEGYVNFYRENLSGLKSLIKLVNSPCDTLISTLAETASDMGFDTEVIHNCLDNSLEGIIVPDAEMGVINITTDTSDREEAYRFFGEALLIHDAWEKIYIENTDYTLIDSLALEYKERYFNETAEKRGLATDRFFGAATASGAVDYIEGITKDIEKRYFIKGRPGTGKSGFLGKLANAALDAGYDVEIYHCAFDPKSLDMVAVRGAGVCFFDSTSPHEYFPKRESDEIIDFYELAVAKNTDTDNHDTLSDFSKAYKEKMQNATAVLKECAERKKEKYDEKQASGLYRFDDIISEFKKTLKNLKNNMPSDVG